MRLPQELIIELQEIMQEEFSTVMTDAEVRDLAEGLVTIFGALSRCERGQF